jgi:hypothetical protein
MVNVTYPTHRMMTGLTTDITRENIQRKFEIAIKTELFRGDGFFSTLELTDEDLSKICNNDIVICNPLIQPILHSFIKIVYSDDDGNNSEFLISDYLYNIIGENHNNPLLHICNNIIDDVVKVFISVTKSAIHDTRVVYNETCKTSNLIEYIACIMYWFGSVWLKQWSNAELITRRSVEDNADATDEE